MQGMYRVSNRDELYLLLGREEIVLSDFLVKTLKKQLSSKGLLSKIFRLPLAVVPKSSKDKEPHEPHIDTPAHINTKETYHLRYDETGSNFRLADCCSPIPGDNVLGFIGDNGEVVVHSVDCPRALALKAGFGSRLLSTCWDATNGKFLAHIHVEGIDRFGILQELIQTISTHMSINIRSLHIVTENEVFRCDLTVLVDDSGVVTELCSQVKRIEGVRQATRIH